MHGRARETKDQTRARKEAAKQKVEKYTKLQNLVLANNAKKKYDPDSLAFSATLLEANPEVYTAWNYRRRSLMTLLPQAEDEDAMNALLETDLRLIERALRKNPKSYGAWHHRKWLVAQGAGKLSHELGLCGQMLDLDERNFHCWSYRRFAADKLAVGVPRELEFAMHKVGQNFSNYSAWHYRTKLLPRLHAPAPAPTAAAPAHDAKAAGHLLTQPRMYYYDLGRRALEEEGERRIPPGDLDEEFQCVQQAFFTEPSDQSGWLYHRWLLACARQGGEAAALLGIVEREAEVVQELMDMEENSKWAMVTMARLLDAQRRLGAPADAARDARIADLYAQLASVDPMRSGYYEQAAANQVEV